MFFELDDIANSISDLNEGMTLDERILWFRQQFGIQAANLLIAEAKSLLIQQYAEAVAAAQADRRTLEDYLFLVRANERAERAEWLAERAEDEAATAAREAAREEHQIEEFLRRVRNDRAYRARLQSELDFEELQEIERRAKRDLDEFWNMMLAIAVARALQTRVVRREQFTRFLPSDAPAAPAPDADHPRPGI